jgi:hypothetical protein
MHSNFMADLSDDAIRILVKYFAATPSPLSAVIVEHCHGAIARVAPDATATALISFAVIRTSLPRRERHTAARLERCCTPGGMGHRLGLSKILIQRFKIAEKAWLRGLAAPF